jgi:hypothetical protein
MADDPNPWDPPTVAEVLGPIRVASPTFAAVWGHESVDRWEPNGYAVMGVLAEHLRALLSQDQTGELAAIFGAVEAMLSNADAALRELLEIHFIGDLQQDAIRSGDWTFADGFIPWLGPEMKQAWKSAFYRWKSERGFRPSV